MTGSVEQKGDQGFRKSDPYGRWRESTYSGTLSFLRRPYSRELEGVDVAVTGIPFDLATTYRPGTRLGPRGVRAGSVQLSEDMVARLDAFFLPEKAVGPRYNRLGQAVVTTEMYPFEQTR